MILKKGIISTCLLSIPLFNQVSSSLSPGCDDLKKLLKKAAKKEGNSNSSTFNNLENAVTCLDPVEFPDAEETSFDTCLATHQVTKTKHIEIFKSCLQETINDPKIGLFFGPNKLSCIENLQNDNSENEFIKKFSKKCLSVSKLNAKDNDKKFKSCMKKCSDKEAKKEIKSCFREMTFEPQNAWPALMMDDERELLGEIVQFDESVNEGIKFYYSPPGNAKNNKDINGNNKVNNKVVVVIHGMAGFQGSRSLSMCDQISLQANAHCIMPDFYRNNDNINNHGGFFNGIGPQQIAFIKKHTPENIIRDYEFSIDYLLEKKFITKTDRISTLGFCWGGFASFVLSNDENNSKYPLKSAASCHPSPTVINQFNSTVNDLFDGIDKPQFIAAAGGGDGPEIKKGGELENILKGKDIDSFFMEFPEMFHGWVNKGDISIPAVARDVKGALEGVFEFFEDYL